jgi:hypothetical protein
MAGPLTEMMMEIGRSQRDQNRDLMNIRQEEARREERKAEAQQAQANLDRVFLAEQERYQAQVADRQQALAAQRREQFYKDVAQFSAFKTPQERTQALVYLDSKYGNTPEGTEFEGLLKNGVFPGDGSYVSQSGEVIEWNVGPDGKTTAKPVAWSPERLKAIDASKAHYEKMINGLLKPSADAKDPVASLSGGQPDLFMQQKKQMLDYYRNELNSLETLKTKFSNGAPAPGMRGPVNPFYGVSPTGAQDQGSLVADSLDLAGRQQPGAPATASTPEPQGAYAEEVKKAREKKAAADAQAAINEQAELRLAQKAKEEAENERRNLLELAKLNGITFARSEPRTELIQELLYEKGVLKRPKTTMKDYPKKPNTRSPGR